MAQAIADRLGSSCVGIHAEAVTQVPIELAMQGRVRARELRADCLVAIGGGSSVGLAKGIALETGIPIINIPTTYSGSEMTGYCGITVDGVKRMFESNNMVARAVVYDSELTLSLPIAASAASAMNALAHCVESAYTPSASPVHMLAGVEGARVLAKNLPRIVAEPSDPEARNEALFGAYLGGAALSGGFALQHALAHTLGGSYGIEHGLSHALILPHVAAYNARFAPEAFIPIAAALQSASAPEGLYDLLIRLELPLSLRDVGIRSQDLGRIADITIDTFQAYNPGPIDYTALCSILEAAYHGERPNAVAS